MIHAKAIEEAARAIRNYCAEYEVRSRGDYTPDPMCHSAEMAKAALTAALPHLQCGGRRTDCTCRSGRDYDGSEFGPCEFCEREADQAAILRDAARWRISQVVYRRLMDYPQGYFSIKDRGEGTVSVGIQPHPITKETAVNACILGRASTEGTAIDRMFRALDGFVDSGALLPAEIEGPRSLAAETSQNRDK